MRALQVVVAPLYCSVGLSFQGVEDPYNLRSKYINGNGKWIKADETGKHWS